MNNTDSNSKFNKVFGIGLGHTGTRSLNKALNILEIPSIHFPADRKTYQELSTGQYHLSLLEKYRAITDITIAPFYSDMDKAYPGSKFILTTRNKDEWLNKWHELDSKKNIDQKIVSKYLRSLRNRLKRDGGIINSLIKPDFYRFLIDLPHYIHRFEFYLIANYGLINLQNKERMGYVYDLHIKNVMEYFKDRPDDLLVMNILEGDGWDKLCKFLSKPVPEEPFPHRR